MRKPKPRKPTEAEREELARRAHVEFDPEFLEIQGTWYSVRELAQAVIAAQKKKPKRRGRPADFLNPFEILDAAALAKVRDGKYAQIAVNWNLTPRQLTDLVQRNRRYFNGKIKQLRANVGI